MTNPKLQKALLCPVPCEHIESALDACSRFGRVAFGSQMVEMFYGIGDKQLIPEGFPVLIYVSMSTSGPTEHKKFLHHHVGLVASYRASYLCWTMANPQGMHCHPDVRPDSAREIDTAVAGFWEVRDLQKLENADRVRLRTAPRHPCHFGYAP